MNSLAMALARPAHTPGQVFGKWPWACYAVCLAMATLCPAEPGRGDGRGILIDGIHANDLSTVGLGPEVYEYHQTTGYRRPFEYLRSRGVRCDRVSEGRLDARRLAPYRLLFINLVSAERPPFWVSEIAAIRSFVVPGGSLLVVTDHSNVYWHTFRLQPLFAELDIESLPETACDEPPQTLGNGSGWITVTRFKPHPVTAGLQCLAMQTGGCVGGRFAVAMTSERSWADAWSTSAYGKENAPGFLGNFRRDAGERAGPLGVVMAKSLGRGRIVVVADENMLGESFLNYADNYRLWLNAVAWLLDEPRLGDPRPYEAWRSPRLLLYEQYDRPVFGSPDPAGCYHAFVLLNRFYWTFAGDRLADPCELLVFAYNDYALSAETAAAVGSHLRRGRNVLILNAEKGALGDELGVVAAVLKGLGVARPKQHAEAGRLVVDIPGGGAIHIVGPGDVLDNVVLPPPIRPPKPAEKKPIQQLLDAVRDALVSGHRG